ncbi:MAG: site-specific DNA-methyltransferase, partial [Planctomycetes bacterium]|nr:site-specific DNA-methyltransferase [Planctomycetota bacterium]
MSSVEITRAMNALNTFSPLYERAMPATRGGSLFNAFPYPTKISPEAIALFIAAHTAPGATVLDGFGGSGSTGLAAILC